MAVLLKNLSAWTEFQMPTNSGGTIPAYFITNNFYGQNEALCVIPNIFVTYTKMDDTSITTNYPTDAEAILQDPTNMAAERTIRGLLPESILGAMVPVQIPTVYTGSISSSNAITWGSLKYEWKTIFLPNTRELGYSNSSTTYYSWTFCSSYPKALPSIASHLSLFNRVDGDLDREVLYRGIGCYFKSTSSSASAPPTQFRRTWLTNISGSYSPPSYTYINKGGVLISLNGNIELSSATNGTVTSSMAIESYRKINGVWYRTT